LARRLTLSDLKQKLTRALRAKAVLAERSKLLGQQAADSRAREQHNNHLVTEMLERQRELHFMLHRANSVLHRIQETNVALSAEFTELVKELPEPQAPDWKERVAKINDLFARTGALTGEAENEIFRRSPDEEEPAPPVSTAQARSKREDAAPEPEAVAAARDPVEPQPAVESAAAGQVAEPDAHEAERVEMQPAAQADFQEETAIDSSSRDRIDRLFGPMKTTEPEPAAPEPENGSRAAGRPSVISRIWRKITPWGKEAISQQEAISPEPEAAAAEQASTQPQAPVESDAADEPEQAPAEVAGQAANEDLPEADQDTPEWAAAEVARPADPAEAARPADESVASESIWVRAKAKLAEIMQRQSVMAVERVKNRRLRRLNRRAGHAQIGPEVHGHG
jgi:hypothetical protein